MCFTEKCRLVILGCCLTFVMVVGSTSGQDLYIYPNQGQSAEKQSQDSYECHTWAVQQTGFDPAATSAAQPPTPATPGGGGMVRGAARGAAVGAVGGAIAGDAGTGAAAGAATGALVGGMRRRSAAHQQAQATAQQQAATSQQHDAYDRALTACLAGRGYTVR